MPYSFTPAANAMNIQGQEYASAAAIQFLPFTSFIGVVPRSGALLTAVHVVMFAPDNTRFSLVDLGWIVKTARVITPL